MDQGQQRQVFIIPELAYLTGCRWEDWHGVIS